MKLKDVINKLLDLEGKYNGNVKVYYLDEYQNLQDVDLVKVVDIPFLGLVVVLKQEEVDLWTILILILIRIFKQLKRLRKIPS